MTDKAVNITYVDFNGKRFYPPFKCLCCGKVITIEQFCYGRLCDYCDTGKCMVGKSHMYKMGHGRKDIFDDAEKIPEVKK